MIHCPNCHKPLDDNALFCGSCGARVQPTVPCPRCGKESPAESVFCQSCGLPLNAASAPTETPDQTPAGTADTPYASPIETPTTPAAPVESASPAAVAPPVATPAAPTVPASPTVPAAAPAAAPRKKGSKKWIGISAVIVAVIAVVAAVAVALPMFVGKSASNYTFYLKDRELFYSDFSKQGAQQVTDRLDSDASVADSISATYKLGKFTTMSKDGKTLFFADKIDTSDDGANLYYRNTDHPKQEATKIDYNVVCYWVNDNATIVIYMKDNGDYDLYQYDLKKMDKTKIDSGLQSRYSIRVSKGGEKLVYLKSDHDLYLKDGNKDKEKLDSNVSSIENVSKDFSTVYYCKDDSLFKKTVGGDRVKLTSDVSTVLKFYDSGEAYYLKKSNESVALSDYVYDDMKDADAAMTPPVYPEYPDWRDYDDEDTYIEAYYTYPAALGDYQAASEVYQEKERRDSLRLQLENRKTDRSKYTLCYCGDSGETVLAEDYVPASIKAAAEGATVVFETYDRGPVSQVPLSKISSISEVQDWVDTALTDSASVTWYVAVKGNAVEITQDNVDRIRISDVGDAVYFVDAAPDTKDTNSAQKAGDLYRITVDGDQVQKAELYDRGVYDGSFRGDNKFCYFKSVKQKSGELYINKVKVDDDVYTDDFRYYKKNDTLVYFADYNTDKGYGTVKMYKGGKTIKVVDDAHAFVFSPKGDVLYLTDYTSSNKGTLFRFDGKKPQKIDEDVMALIPYFDAEDRESYRLWD